MCIDFRKNIDDKITYGVQLQENYFNAYVELKENITSEQEKKIDELLRNNVLCNNVIKELKNSQLCRHYKEKFRYHSIFLGEYFSIDDLKNRLKSIFDNFAEKDTRAKLKAITV